MVDISVTAMLDYINETPNILQNLLNNRKQYTKEFVDVFKAEKFQRMIIIGSGTSYHGGAGIRSFVEKMLQIPVEANYPNLFINYDTVFNCKTLVLGVSQGGESKSTINGIEYAKKQGCYTVSLTQDGAESKLATHTELALSMHCGEELAGPKTKGYQATMMSIILLSLETALSLNKIDSVTYNNIIERLQKTINNLPAGINAAEKWYTTNRNDFMTAKRILVVGYDNNYGNVLEGRLKIQEAVRYGVEGYELEEFMHGIYHSIDDDVHIIYLAQSGEHKDRTIRLRDFMHDYTSHEFVIGDFDAPICDEKKNLCFNYVDDEQFCIFEYIIPLQILAFYLSRDLGINANIPKIKNFHYLMGSK